MYGDTDVMRHRVDRLREQAGDIRATADGLVARAESVAWSGRAAAAMRVRIKERAVALRAIAERHETAADALERHLLDVDRTKETIAAAQKRAEALLADGRLAGRTLPAAGHKAWLEVELA
ncbi:hypothetical protein AB3X52_09980 [Nocardioides sp. DS6]|uniref:Uncharacterized protein n=1 Tax=Nocardioides eburneus TaxID=3231482 RepID=A0ABV3SYB9_9ACTN